MTILTVVANRAVYIDANNPDTNYGAQDNMSIGVLYFGGDKVEQDRAIGNFDVSVLAGRTVVSAKMVRQIYAVGPGGQAATMRRCTRPADWVEAEATWNDYKTSTAWTMAGGDVDNTTPTPVGYTEASGSGSHEITGLKGFVDDAVDSRSDIVSVIMRSDDESPGESALVRFRGPGNATPSFRWRLEIEVPSVGGFNMKNYG